MSLLSLHKILFFFLKLKKKKNTHKTLVYSETQQGVESEAFPVSSAGLQGHPALKGPGSLQGSGN